MNFLSSPPLCTGHALWQSMSRRECLNRFALGLGGVALAQLLGRDARAAETPVPPRYHFAPKAKRIIYLFQSGGPSQLDLFDYKPLLNQKHGEQLPDAVRGGQRLTGMSSNQSSLPLVGSQFGFKQYGKNGTWVSEIGRASCRERV